MAALVGLLAAVLVFLLVRRGLRALSAAGSARRRLLAAGLPARGLVLSADVLAGEATSNGQRFETRALLLDVEVAGQAPYEVAVTPLIPRMCDAVPGAWLDLRVDPKYPSQVTVVGPAGSSGWLSAAPWLATGPAAAASKQNASPAVGAGFVAAVVFVAVTSAMSDASRHHAKAGHTAPASHPAGVAHPECDAAARCCASLSSTDCHRFSTMTEDACAAWLRGDRPNGSRGKRRCP